VNDDATLIQSSSDSSNSVSDMEAETHDEVKKYDYEENKPSEENTPDETNNAPDKKEEMCEKMMDFKLEKSEIDVVEESDSDNSSDDKLPVNATGRDFKFGTVRTSQ
jgi:hypothetical protein